MEDRILQKAAKWAVARLICAPAFLMPYRMRIGYIKLLSAVFHAPFRAFGRLARVLLDLLQIEPRDPRSSPASAGFKHTAQERTASGSVAVLFSGGTDSTCTAVLMAPTHTEVHLLTFHEHATRFSPEPRANVLLLQKHFPQTIFHHQMFSVDSLVRHLCYERYIRNVAKHGLLALANPGFSALSWHIRTIVYCLEHDITKVVDGLTRELMHFPGHMDAVVAEIRLLYRKFGIIYENPVREWHTPPDQQFIDKVIVNRHEDFLFGDWQHGSERTTGRYLFELGLFPSPNIKGSSIDFSMQHDCYPFSLYNIIAFWGYLSVEPYPLFCDRIARIMQEKIASAKQLIEEYRALGERSHMDVLIQR